MTGLVVEGLRVAYAPGRPVVDGVDLLVPAGALTALLGPSGCGKTTLLKTVAGLLHPDAGDVRIGGTSVLGVPAERRPAGVVFQKPLLFPHLSVGGNVAFGLRMRRVPRAERHRRVRAMLDLVRLPEAAGRRVGELSGGQEQRVALARALVLDPPVLLLDEPFSQLDADLRAGMRELVRRVQRELGITMLFVTHDQQEAVELADRIALMIDGRIEAHGPPREFYTRPATLQTARFFGSGNEVPGTLAGTTFTCALGTLEVAGGGTDGPGVLVVRPDAVRLVAPTGSNVVPATVRTVRFHGTHQLLTLVLSGTMQLMASVHPTTPVEVGDQVHAQLPPAACHVLPPLAGVPRPASERARA